jgi:hypothetical protein
MVREKLKHTEREVFIFVKWEVSVLALETYLLSKCIFSEKQRNKRKN